ncbi:CVNH domain-containing protein [Apiospora marii]|uniref:CVNH domain-containing protein n=1 Tax=Apiospora marii TaxID=335849 RepID=A0ABR1RYE3_9PEZI
MKAVQIISALIAVSSAVNWGNNCFDEQLDAATGLLTANCDAGDGQGTLKPASINLNECYGWANQKLAAIPQGNYGDSCTDCSISRLVHRLPIYRKTVWLNCTCGDPPVDASLNTGKATPDPFRSGAHHGTAQANKYTLIAEVTSLKNEFGVLKC